MTNELKPCPFCGGEAGISEVEEESLGYNEIINYEVGCHRCRIETLALRDLNDAIEAWNTRQPAFDWKPIEELKDEDLIKTNYILLRFICISKYDVPYAIGYVYKHTKNDGEITNRVSMYGQTFEMDEIKKGYSDYALLTPPKE